MWLRIVKLDLQSIGISLDPYQIVIVIIDQTILASFGDNPVTFLDDDTVP